MRSHLLIFKVTLFFLCISLTSYSQNKEGLNRSFKRTIPNQNSITIKGNIKSLAMDTVLLDSYAFQYMDMITGKNVFIPISKDTAGNFVVSFPVHGYQEIQLAKGLKINDQVHYDFYYMNRFYVKPGQDMVLDYKLLKDFSTVNLFKGNLSESNNEQTKYSKSRQDAGLADIIPVNYYLDSVKPGGYKTFKNLLLSQLKKMDSFHDQHFKQVKTSAFFKKQADIEQRYIVAHYLLMSLNATKEKDPGVLNFLDSIGSPLDNPEAYGNSSYKTFLNTYYQYLTREIFNPGQKLNVLFTDLAKYLLKEHIEVSEDEKSIYRNMLDTLNTSKKDASKILSQEYILKYSEEYVMAYRTKITFDSIASNKDPFVRNIFLTRLLREHLDNGRLVIINSLIPRYKQIVNDNPVKKLFLEDYQQAYDVFYKSKLSINSRLYDATKISPGAIVEKILDQFKGKVVYIDVWATWCLPCLSEMSKSKKLREQFVNNDVVFLYLCINSPSESTWKRLIAGHQIEGENYFLNLMQSAELSKKLNIGFIPRYLIVDRFGNISNSQAGNPSNVNVQNELKDLLGK